MRRHAWENASEVMEPDVYDWREAAACRDTDPAVFEIEGSSPRVRRRIREVIDNWCAECPVRQTCLQEAIGDLQSEDLGSMPYGIRGGRYMPDVAKELQVRRARKLGPSAGACGDKRGTNTGASRHYAAGERPCPECLEAKRESARRHRPITGKNQRGQDMYARADQILRETNQTQREVAEIFGIPVKTLNSGLHRHRHRQAAS